MSGFNKVYPIGQAGSLVVEESAGVVKATLALVESAGGGKTEGFLKAHLSGGVELDALLLVNVGLDLISAKHPTATALVDGLKAIIDAAAAKN